MATRKTSRKATKKAHKAPVSKDVQCLLNGPPCGVVSNPEGLSIAQAANQIARDNGLKSYSILVDGVKVGVEEAAKALSGHKSIEVFAKETRG
jgi:hypothetical protein